VFSWSGASRCGESPNSRERDRVLAHSVGLEAFDPATCGYTAGGSGLESSEVMTSSAPKIQAHQTVHHISRCCMRLSLIIAKRTVDWEAELPSQAYS
jgi:hypothetical protein